MPYADSLQRYDDTKFSLIFSLVGETDEDYVYDCGTYEEAISFRQIAYMWRMAAEKDYAQRMKNINQPKKENKVAALLAHNDLVDMEMQELENLRKRRKLLDFAQRVMIKNKPPKSQFLVFTCSRFRFNTSTNDIIEFAKKHADKLDKKGETYQALFGEFDD